MKRLLMLPAALLLLAACGAEPEEAAPVSALDVIPDETLLTLVVVDPAAAVEAMDSYAAGAPLLGETMVSDWLLTALDCADMQEVSGRYGIDPAGTAVVWMQSIMPQSIGAALPVSDAALFWETVGVQPVVDEPIGDHEVASFDVDFGKIYTCGTGGLLLVSGSRAGLQGILERIDGSVPAWLPGLPDGCLYGYAKVSTFGPMAAQQIEMLRPQIIAQMTAAGEGSGMVPNLVDLYLDAIGILLTQTDSADFLAAFDSERIRMTSTATFVEGSDLSGVFAPIEARDMTPLLPAGGVAVARVSIDPAASAALMEAVIGAMGVDSVPPETVAFWAACSRNAAISIQPSVEGSIGMVAVYEMPDGGDLGQVMDVYRSQFDRMSSMLAIPGLAFAPVERVELDGREWVTFGMSMDPAALAAGMAEDSAVEPQVEMPTISWTAWLTVGDGLLYMEMAPEPVAVPALLDGTWTGDTAESTPGMSDLSPDAEVAAVVDLSGYLDMVLGMTGLGLPRIDSEPVWLEMEIDFQQDRVVHHCSVDGSDLVAFIARVAQTFGALQSE